MKNVELVPLRVSDNSIVGSIDEIASDVMIPDTRIPSESETGTESSSGSISTEWNIDEQDDFLASVMCSSWVEGNDWDSVDGTGTKTLELGTSRDVYSMIKKYPQSPVEYKWFKGLQLNQLGIDMALNSFVKLTWDFLGANNPKAVSADPTTGLTNVTYGEAFTTKSFKTLEGSFFMGDAKGSHDVQIRQSSAFNMTINNNKERTDALFETEAIEMSDGDFAVEGSFDIWKADTLATTIENLAIEGKKKWLEISVSRTYEGKVYKYAIQLLAKLKSPSESKDGSKLKNTINFSVHDKGGIKIIKTVSEAV